MKQREFFVTVTDAQGGTLGYGGPYVPVSHRFWWDGNQPHGAQSVMKLFKSQAELVFFFNLFTTQESGTHGNISWKQERTVE